MNLKGILSISGYPDLYRLVTQARNGIIVESLLTKKRMQAFASSKISSLEDIAIYTTDDDFPLVNVFKNIYELEEGNKCIDSKLGNEEVKEYFEKILPNYDKDRVYLSDMRRVYKWYNMLHGLNLLDFSEPVVTENTEEKLIENEEVAS